MKKYLKTKRSLFEIVDENENVYFVKSKKDNHIYSKSKRYSDIVAVSDRVKELCDEFIFFDEDGNPRFAYKKREWFLEAFKISSKLYGAIWTNKGLIFVAELTKKGGWKLL